MQEVRSDSLMLRRATMLMLIVFAWLVRTLATLGFDGLTACSISCRVVCPLCLRRTATDPLVFVSVPVLLIAVSVVASNVPARKGHDDRIRWCR